MKKRTPSPPNIPPPPPYCIVPTTPYTHRYTLFFQTLPGLEPGPEPLISCSVCNPALYPLDHQGFVANFTHICCCYNLFGPRPPNAWLLFNKEMNWFEKKCYVMLCDVML